MGQDRPRKRGRPLARCPKSIEPMFRRVYDAKGIGPSRAAIYTLARELFRRGQPRTTVEHTLCAMRRDLGLSVLTVVFIARVAQTKGGLPWERRVIGSYPQAQK